MGMIIVSLIIHHNYIKTLSVWPIFPQSGRILNVYFMKTANILVYGYITVYGYVLNYYDTWFGLRAELHALSIAK